MKSSLKRIFLAVATAGLCLFAPAQSTGGHNRNV